MRDAPRRPSRRDHRGGEHPGVPHEYDAIASDADVSRRAQNDRDRVLRSL